MNLVELLTVIAIFLCAFGLSKILHPIGGLWLSIPGFIVGGFLIPFLLFMFVRSKKNTKGNR